MRILKYVLSLEDPQDVRNALEEAFTPGPDLVGLCATPPLLLVDTVLLHVYSVLVQYNEVVYPVYVPGTGTLWYCG